MALTLDGTSTPSGGRSTGLPKDSTDFLVEFSVVLHKRAMYPPGHPHLTEATERFIQRLELLVRARGVFSAGVAGHQLILSGVATDPRHALLSDLARRLHRHRIATFRFEPDVTAAELDELFSTLAADPLGPLGPAGLQPGATTRWPHIRLQPPDVTRLLLDDEEAEPTEARETPEGSLWQALAQLALSTDGHPVTELDDPLVVARAIEEQLNDPGYDRIVLDYLGQIAGQLSIDPADVETGVRAQASQLIASLRPETLRRILELGADNAARRDFARTAARAFAVDAVIEVVDAAAATTGRTISHQLLRMLHKLASHAEHASPEVASDAEAALRQSVERLLSDWELEDPNPDAYNAVLDGMMPQAPQRGASGDESGEGGPELVLQTGLEIGCVGPRVIVALDAMVAAGALGRAVELLRDAPAESAVAAEDLWRHVTNADRLREQLAEPRVNFDLVESLALRLGAAAIEPLLDTLEQATDRSARARTLRIIVALGPSAASAAVQRLPDAPWYVQRNLLSVLRQLAVWPSGFSAEPYTRHPEPRLRHEALKLMLEVEAHRTAAITRGLDDPDPSILALVVRAAFEDCPRVAAPGLERFARDRRQSSDLRAIALRALASVAGADAVPCLLELAGAKRRFFRWRVGAKSPVVLAALDELARRGSGHPVVPHVLATARRNVDPDVRIAAGLRLA
ncbi:MAG: hypothetical protein ABIO99_06495 [Candidatus Limnocylindria bacterium]